MSALSMVGTASGLPCWSGLGSGRSWRHLQIGGAGFFLAFDERLEIEGGLVAIGKGIGAYLVQVLLNAEADMLDVGLLHIGEAVAILLQDRLVTGFGFGRALF